VRECRIILGCMTKIVQISPLFYFSIFPGSHSVICPDARHCCVSVVKGYLAFTKKVVEEQFLLKTTQYFRDSSKVDSNLSNRYVIFLFFMIQNIEVTVPGNSIFPVTQLVSYLWVTYIFFETPKFYWKTFMIQSVLPFITFFSYLFYFDVRM
jgi:hypothetical protein